MQIQSEQKTLPAEAEERDENTASLSEAAKQETARLLKGTLRTVMRVHELAKAETRYHRELLGELKRCERDRVKANLQTGYLADLAEAITRIDALEERCEDSPHFLKAACVSLVESGDYSAACAAWSGSNEHYRVRAEGCREWARSLENSLGQGRQPDCFARALSRQEPQVMPEEAPACQSCPLTDSCPGGTTVVCCASGPRPGRGSVLAASIQSSRMPARTELLLLSHLVRHIGAVCHGNTSAGGSRGGQTNDAYRENERHGAVENADGEARPVDLALTGDQVPHLQLRQSQRMEVMGQLAGGVAHDFNNLLVVISGYARLAREKLEPESPLLSDIDEIVDAAGRASNLTRQLLTFSRRQTMNPELLDLNELIDRTFRMLRRLIGEHIELEFEPMSEPVLVRADPAQVEQVLLNLAVNARDAMPDGGRLTIRTDKGEGKQDRVRLSVIDTGRGIDASIRQHIFEPFFTTKGEQGTGLGLATVQGIAKQHGGDVSVRSRAEGGTAVHVLLPAAEKVAGGEEAESRPENSPTGAENILLVEDEEIVREVSRRVLETRGYTVEATSSAEEARDIFSRLKGRIDLLMTDIVLPGEDGAQLYQALAERNPSLKVLYVSGYRKEGPLSPDFAASGAGFLRKPFTPEELARKVRRTLDVSPLASRGECVEKSCSPG